MNVDTGNFSGSPFILSDRLIVTERPSHQSRSSDLRLARAGGTGAASLFDTGRHRQNPVTVIVGAAGRYVARLRDFLVATSLLCTVLVPQLLVATASFATAFCCHGFCVPWLLVQRLLCTASCGYGFCWQLQLSLLAGSFLWHSFLCHGFLVHMLLVATTSCDAFLDGLVCDRQSVELVRPVVWQDRPLEREASLEQLQRTVLEVVGSWPR